MSRETGWSRSWGDQGPTVLWRTNVGTGFSSFAAVGQRVYTLGNDGANDTVFCLDALTGQVVWRHTYPCLPQPLSYEGGPSATPWHDAGRLYTFSKSGDLICLDARRGAVLWTRQFPPWPQGPGDWPNRWGYAGSPVRVDDRLILSVGQSGIALNPTNGATLWESPAGHPGYSSPVPFRRAGQPALAFFSGHAIVGAEASTGRPVWRVPWNTLWDLNAADPLMEAGRMFVSSGNGVGCALFEVGEGEPRELWRNRKLKTTMNSAVLWDGCLYGFNDTHLACLAWETGEELWSTRELRNGALMVADGVLVALSETGALALVRPSRAAFEPLAQAKVLEGRCWTTPVLSRGLLFLRNAAGEVVCVDLRTPS